MPPLPPSFRRAIEQAPTWLAVATIDAVTHPAPLPPGEQMVIWPGGAVGTISAGCVDSDVVTVANSVLADGRSRRRVYGPDGGPLAVTTCGGTIEVGIDRIRVGSDPDATLRGIAERAHRYTRESGRPATVYLLGATTIAARLASILSALGLAVVVIDPRPIFATAIQVPDASEVICGWPQEILRARGLGSGDAVVLLTHDERYAASSLALALRCGAGYVGALASASTAAGHRAALATADVPDEQVTQLHSPIGLSIGARGSAEIAVSIVSELIQCTGRLRT